MSHYTVAVVTQEYPKDEVLEDILAPYSEHLIVAPYVCQTKAEIIKEAKEIAESIKKRIAEGEEFTNKSVGKYINAKTDEDFYNASYSNFCKYDEEGNELSTYNPNSKWDWWVVGGRWDGHWDGENTLSLKDFVDYMKEDVEGRRTYAVLDVNGVWHEPGKMGWWAISSATDEDRANFTEKYLSFFDGYEDDWYVTLVDCHI